MKNMKVRVQKRGAELEVLNFINFLVSFLIIWYNFLAIRVNTKLNLIS